nr:SpoIIE family protein phosphatase [Nocardioides flavescens]
MFLAAPVAMVVFRASDLLMVEANQAYLDAVGLAREDVVGRAVFDVFPDSPMRTDDQVTSARAIFDRVIASGVAETIHELRYDIAGADGFEQRWWTFTETPLRDAEGRVALLLHAVHEVTELRRTRGELTRAEEAERTTTAQLARLAEVALDLARAESLADVEAAAIGAGLSAVGASGGCLLTATDGGAWRVTASASATTELQRRYPELPVDSEFPAAVAARTGQRVVLRTEAESLAFSATMAEIFEITDRQAFVCLPMVSQGRPVGCLQLSWDAERDFSAAELELMEGLAAQCATAVDRAEQAERRRRSAEQITALADALQSAMVTALPTLEDVDIAVRYRTASDIARVGGDWYDAFVQPRGDLVVVIGDVSGHDDVAAGRMGQVRGLLRGLAYDDRMTVPDSPAAVLTRLERVSRGLGSDQLSTAVLVRIGTTGADGRRPVAWSNAGNPPPALLRADGSVVLLEGERSDLILGVEPNTPRTNLATDLGPGDTLLLYTDGLVERREADLDRGLRDLREALSDLAGTDPETLCDAVLERLDPHRGDDDVAMVAVRVRVRG